MNAAKYETSVLSGGKVEVTLSHMLEGTRVEVIILFPEETPDTHTHLLSASESSLGFWDNPVDDEIWNTA